MRLIAEIMYMKLFAVTPSHVLITVSRNGERFQYIQRLEEMEGNQLMLTDRCDAYRRVRMTQNTD